jgi:hypothetical protein
MSADLNAMVSYSNGSINAGDYQLGQIGNCCYPNYWDTHYHYYQSYPSITISPEKSKIEQAFKIMGKLMEKGIVDKISLKKFIEMVNEIATVL